MISVVVTVRNEGRHIADLLDSLVVQEPPFEVIIVDAGSEDDTQDIVREYAKKYDMIKLHIHGGKRGDSRNYGVEQAKGEVVAFTDGDCIANPFWLKEIRKSLSEGHIVAGKTIQLGYLPFVELARVELLHRGKDVTWPSCNLAYMVDVFKEINGFDPTFRTAEDIDLNYRALLAGYRLVANDKAIIYHRARDTMKGFFKQAFWNGFGRKQLTMKHGTLWGNYKFFDMLKANASFWYLARMGVAVLGYAACIVGFWGVRIEK